MAANYTKIQTTLSSETLISRVLTALLEYAALSGTNHFRTLITVANAYDKTLTEDARAIGFDTAHYDTSMVPNVRALYRNYRGVIQSQSGWAGVLSREINLSDADKSVQAFITYRYENINLGEIHNIDKQGPFGGLYKQMQIDGQYIVSNYVQAAALTALGVTRGTLSDSSVIPSNFLSNCHTGTLTFKCTNESTTAPQLSVVNTIAPNSSASALSAGLPDGSNVVTAENPLTVNKSFDDMKVGLSSLTLIRPGLAAPTVTGDNVSTPLFSSVTVTSPYDGDCYKGIFYVRVTAQSTAPLWLIEFFSDSGLTNKVGAITTDTNIGSVALTKTLNSGSVLAFTFNRANAHTVLASFGQTLSISVDIKTPRIGDVWTMAITNNYNGLCATLIGKMWPGTLPAIPKKPGAATAALAGAGAGNVDNGTHSWKVTLVGPGGESPAGTGSNQINVANKAANGQISLTAIPVGAALTGVTSRNIYRTVAGDAGNYKLVGSIADNVTTTYTDNIADASLGGIAPTSTQWDDTLFTAFSIS
jgi:hypothetical protein